MPTAPTNPTPLPIPPSTSDPANFDPRADAFLGALGGFQTQTNALALVTYNNAVEAFNSATAANSSKDSAAADAISANQAKAAAEAARDIAVQARDDMQKLYLGAKATPPTTDNTGQPLVAGAWYTNTTDNYWYWWTGSTWKLGVGDLSTVDWTTQVTGKPSTVDGYGITNAVTTNATLGNIDLNTAVATRTGFYRFESATNGPKDFTVNYGQLIVSHSGDTIVQMVFSYSDNTGWMRVGTESDFINKVWKPMGNHPLRYVDDNTNYMYGNENGGLNMVNVFRASGNIAKYLPKYPVDGDRCTIVIANGRADNTVHPAAGSGHLIMGLAESMTIDNANATVVFVMSGGNWRIV